LLRTFLVAIAQNSKEPMTREVISGISSRGWRGCEDPTGSRAAFAVVVTFTVNVVGTDPDTVTEPAGTTQFAFAGAPEQVMVTFTDPLDPFASPIESE